jgi:hypothetical protein
MCDYSLTGIPNRLAAVGEELITHRFPTGSIGMASARDLSKINSIEASRPRPHGFWATIKYLLAGPKLTEPVCAVCIAPGTVLQMSRIPDAVRRQFAVSAVEDVTFTQLTAEPFQYRDAIRFRNGRHLLLQSLQEGILFKVQSDSVERSVPGVIELRERTDATDPRRIPA